MSWKKEEIDAYNFLTNFELKDIIFEEFGQSNSNVPDIKVLKKGTFAFYVEVKKKDAQSSQFVIEKLDKKFKYSDQNKKEINQYKIKILEHLTDHFNDYNNISSSQIEVKCDKALGYEHIIADLKSKDIRYIMSREKNADFKIIHINNFKFFFDIKCILRNKKSGSHPVSKKNINSVSNYVIKNYDASNINIVDSKKFLFKSKFSGLLGSYFRLENEKYFISKEKIDGFFIVRKTGKTNNPNIIFKVQLINSHLNDDIKLFLKDLSV